MKQRPMPSLSRNFVKLTLLLGCISPVVAHGQDEHGSMTMEMADATAAAASGTMMAEPASYFQLTEHTGLMFAHILLMTIGWVFVLPISVMLSISRSRYRFPVQFLFIALNAVGVVLVTIYNASTPDMYPNNAHHKLGWILTWVVTAQGVMGVLSAYAGAQEKREEEFMPVSAAAMEHHRRMQRPQISDMYRFSYDSGHGTEPTTESLRSESVSSRGEDELPEAQPAAEEEDDDIEKHGLMHGSRVDKYLSNRILALLSSKVLRIFRWLYDVVDRLILILGWAGLVTGTVTYGALFMGPELFNGLAHFIKGGVFFWYGILTLGRWAGFFADIGWAWNVKPSTSNKPSAEFVESFLIFFYGSTNAFLEHLTAWGSAWSAQDLEHVSITIMFFGGGLCGMLIESSRVRDLLNTVQQVSQHSYHSEGQSALEPPKSYRFSMNPLPALIVLLLGVMMSSHHQESMVSTMIHKQWGTLLVGAAFARALTYVIFYLAPPTSMLPGRPPSELITAFCLLAGGFVFMLSARDVVETMEQYGLDAMFIFTVTMGLITFLMAWIVVVIAIKGWAVRRENRSRFVSHEGLMSP
ncbi:hypothetical protein D0Z07_7112 [Hyphodiscus hymeniophilus]|uniref:Integral membrane protein n=1 Tax=Hyphodiscus hymeniophilus TaxID=353542 RepID=A0A9P7AUZ2_9HELO|nr:hypothetical protein D0Z07_7112 [Hyphodiscus hymeniophilus]